MLFPVPEHKIVSNRTQELWEEEYKLASVKARRFLVGSLFG
jgi:hypothetical protein